MKAEDIVWSIFLDDSGDVDTWLEANRVGYSDSRDPDVGGTRTWIDRMPDGHHKVKQRLGQRVHFSHMKNRVQVKDGHVNIASCQKAVAELLNRFNDGDHRFIEAVHWNDDKTVSFTLGS